MKKKKGRKRKQAAKADRIKDLAIDILSGTITGLLVELIMKLIE